MGHAKTMSPTGQIIENVLEHITVNSWLHVINWENWVFGLADDENHAKEWHKNNSRPAPRYWASFDCGDAGIAQSVLKHFRLLGVPEGEKNPENSGNGRILYAYKTSL